VAAAAVSGKMVMGQFVRVLGEVWRVLCGAGRGGVVRLSERVCVLRGSGTVWLFEDLNGNWCSKTVRLRMPALTGLANWGSLFSKDVLFGSIWILSQNRFGLNGIPYSRMQPLTGWKMIHLIGPGTLGECYFRI
jgi:hypothetical protein